MLVDNPLNEEEEQVLRIVNNYTGDDPYFQVAISDLTDEELAQLSPDILARLLQVYLEEEPTNYSRVGWLLRRLRQVGAPGAIDFLVANLHRFAPILGDVARYVMASASNYVGNLADLGERMVNQFQLPVIARSPYLQLVLLDVLASVPTLDHAEAVTARYGMSDPAVRREILRVAAANGLGAWLRGHRHEFRTMDPWSRVAYLRGLREFPGDEAEHWLREIRRTLTPLERLVVRYVFDDRAMRLGSVTLA